MNVGQFISILRARWAISVGVLVAVLVLALGISLITPKSYTATGSVVVDAKPDPVSTMLYPGVMSPAFMATQVDIIQSDRVALRVVRTLKLAENPAIREQWLNSTGGEGSIEQWLIDTFQKSMEVKPSKESSVINVSYKAPDPRFAAGLANAFIQAYIDTSLEMRVDPAKQYSAFFDTRAKEAREAVEKAQAKLSAFQSEKGIIANDERIDVENSRLNELSSQLVAVQALQAESGSRQNQAQGASGDKLQEVLGNPIISNLKVELAHNEARLQELNSKLGENHPQIVEIKANIAETRKRIESETARVTGGVTVSNTINKQRTAEIRAALDAQREKVLRLKAVRDEGSVIVRDVENAQRSYDAVLARLNQTSLESQTTQSSVYFLTQATPPLSASSPRVFRNMLIATFLGCFGGLIAAFGFELLNRRTRTVADVNSALGLPVIGVIPTADSKRLFAASRRIGMQQRVLGHSASTK